MSSKSSLPWSGGPNYGGPSALASAIRHQWIIWMSVPPVVGFITALWFPSKSSLPFPWDHVSSGIGWTYFTAWSISFYPQVWLNYSRKSVQGLSLDFQVLNLLGFVAYSVYNGFLYWNPLIREQYSRAHAGHNPAVHANDVGFAIHAVVLTAITLAQSLRYPANRHPPSTLTWAGMTAALASIGAYALYLYSEPDIDPTCTNECTQSQWLTWLGLLYAISMIKLGVSLVKYIPQVILNWRLQSTRGWNVWNVLLDFEGGMLSLVQLVIDDAIAKDWTAITGNPIKFGLGFISMIFDIIFYVQHLVYHNNGAEEIIVDQLTVGSEPSSQEPTYSLIPTDDPAVGQGPQEP